MLKRKRIWLLISLLGIGVLLSIFFFYIQRNTQQHFFRPVETKIHQIEKEFDEDFLEILMQNRPNDSITFSSLSISTQHSYYLYNESNELVYWSNFEFVPDFGLLKTNKNFTIYEDQKGLFLTKIRRLSRSERGYWLIQVFPLKYKSVIENDFIPNGFNNEIFGNQRVKISETPQDDYLDIHSQKGDYLFSLNFEPGYQAIGQRSNFTLLIFFFSLLTLVLIQGYSFVSTLWKRKKPILSIFYSALILFSIRGFMLFFNFPQDFFDFKLFDSRYFAVSVLNPSLGDLFLNILSLFVILSLLFFDLSTYKISHFLKSRISFNKQWLVYLMTFLFTTICLIVFYSLYIHIQSNAQWELNIQSILSFDYFKAISLIIVFLGAAGYLLFSIFSIKMVLEESLIGRKYALKILIYYSAPILFFLTFYEPLYLIVYLAHLVFLASIISFELYDKIFKLGLNTFLTFFFGCLVASIITGTASHQVHLNSQQQSKLRFGEQQMVENDVIAEFFLSDMINRIKEDLFIKNNFADPLQSKESIGQKIRKIHITNYFDQYDVQIKLFNPSGDNLIDLQSNETLNDLRFTYIKSDYATSTRNLYFVKDMEEGFRVKYFAFIPIYKDLKFVGTVFLQFVQLKILPGSVFPKLLLDKKYMINVNDKKYDFAVYNDGALQYSVGVFNYRASNFESLLDQKSLFGKGLSYKGYHHLAIQNQEKVIIVSSPSQPFLYVLADVSFFFVSFILFTIFSILIFVFAKGINHLNFNYSAKLQVYLNFAFFFPILIVSVIIVTLLTRSYTEELHRQYFQKAGLIADNISPILEKQISGDADKDDISETINYLSGTTYTDINVFNPSGVLVATSQPNTFDKKILTKYINPQAIVAIIEGQNNQILLEEYVGQLFFKTVYIAIRSSDSQKVRAIVAIPFFESASDLNFLITEVLSNIIIVFVVIFIVFLIVSYFVSSNLTVPFKLITQKLKNTNLDSNEPMYWPSNDEIGLLVREYNNMLFKLESSKKVLAESEKESAWREMAKQVAHEIKNPLTPMKLTLQHLLRLQAAGKIENPEMLKRPIETLIQQVDTLSDIATSFSSFAKMPIPLNEEIDLKSLVRGICELFKNNKLETLNFIDSTDADKIMIMADAKLLGRIISNLIINGVQAVEGKKAIIEVFLRLVDNWVQLEIRDNGKGIPEENKLKIFVPNFSTKSEGSGLGLAIAKRGVEASGGKIRFETELNKGTSFFISFPVLSDGSH
jgi:two-component system, NtrC family, nitrogen regulation sensor histidine kinase NtrY